jgi:hypothetical protein
MAQPPPPIHFEDIPLAQARTMGRGPRMDPELYQAVKGKIQSLDNTATRLTVREGTSVTTMKNRILRVAAELGMPITVRRVPGGLVFWRSTQEDIRQAQEVGARLQTTHGQDLLYLSGEFSRLTCTSPQAVTGHGLCCRNPRRRRSGFRL